MISIVIAVVVEVVLAFSDRNVIGFDIRTTEGYIAGCCRVRYPPGGVRPLHFYCIVIVYRTTQTIFEVSVVFFGSIFLYLYRTMYRKFRDNIQHYY